MSGEVKRFFEGCWQLLSCTRTEQPIFLLLSFYYAEIRLIHDISLVLFLEL